MSLVFRRFSAAVLLPVLTLLVIAMTISCGGTRSSKSDERSPGQVAFEANCQTCHRLPNAWMRTDDEWPGLVARYGQRAKINEETITLIVSYLQATNSD